MEHTSDNRNSEYFDIHKFSGYLGNQVSTVYSMTAGRKIPHYRVGRLLRFKKSDIDHWMEANRYECIDPGKEAKRSLGLIPKRGIGIDQVVRKAVDGTRGQEYTASYGKPTDSIKGLGRGVSNGIV